MSQDDREDPGQERSAQDAQLRALLAELGSGPSGEQLPPAVAARLDETLARLVAERDAAEPETASTGTDPGTDPGTDAGTDAGDRARVVPLRARWLPRAAAAAAAVIVLAVAGVATGAFGLLTHETTTTSGAGASSTTADKASGAQEGAEGDLPAVGAASFAADVSRLVRDGGQAIAPQPATQGEGRDLASSPPPATDPLARVGCTGPEVRDGSTTTPIRYDGALAVLVVHPVAGGTRLAEAWSCSGRTRLASARVAP